MATQQIQKQRRSQQIDVAQIYQQANALYQQAEKEPHLLTLDDAYTLALQAHTLQTDYLPIINLLARIELKRQAYANAWQWIHLGLTLYPKSPGLLYSAGHLALAEHNLKQAEHYFKQSLSISKTATRAASSLAQVYLLQQDFVAAFQAYRELARTQSHLPQIKENLFVACSHIHADFYAIELEQDLLDYLDYPNVDYSLLAPLITSLLQHKFKLSQQGCPLELETLVQDPLLLKALTRFYFCDALMERLLITLRQSILFTTAGELAIEHLFVPFVSALGQQTQLNEGVYYSTEREDEMLAQLSIILQKMLAQSEVKGQDIYPILLLLLMYKPLEQLECYTQLRRMSLVLPEFIHQRIQQQLAQIASEQHLAQTMPKRGKVRNQTSKAVQQQYLTHPYPRWQSLNEQSKGDYAHALELHFPNHNWQTLKKCHNWQVLVAGCGTGRHAINLAKHFYGLNITAIDLSARSLAYAQHKAQTFKLNNIKFYQADILEQGDSGEQYELIEASGVLHHMHCPQAGLDALVRQLKSGGVIKLGLYSQTARQQITHLRNLLKENMPRSDAQIRLVREALLQKQINADVSEIISSPDFYSLSGCRDLLFHTQEHLFDIDKLQELISHANLQWVGFLPPASAYFYAQNLFNQKPHELSLEKWQQMETEYPSLFAGMYQFYARKA